MGDVLAIMALTASMGLHADRRDWEAAAGLFAPQVRVDYT
jgi:hypothetical protein